MSEIFELPELDTMTTVDEVHAYCDERARRVLAFCEMHELKIACAESLTGGLLADAFVRIPGASKVFLGSAVTYDIRAKASVLGVNRELLLAEGAVDPNVAMQMAHSTALLFNQEQYGHRVIGLSTTGVAGPGPDEGKPAGLVYVGFFIPDYAGSKIGEKNFALRLSLKGARELIRQKSVACILGKMEEFTGYSQE